MITPEHIRKVLAEIHSRVPKTLRESVVVTEKASPTIEMVMEKAMTMESIPQEKRDQIKVLYDAGEFSKVKTKENPKVAKQIDAFVSREINKAVKAGLLPKKRELLKIMKEDEQKRNNRSAEAENPVE